MNMSAKTGTHGLASQIVIVEETTAWRR